MLKAKIKHYLSGIPFAAVAALAAVLLLALSGPVSAQYVTQGYASDEDLQKGLIVQLSPDDLTKVIPVSADTMKDMLGVIVDSNDAPVTLSNEDNRAFVATTGRYGVLVSTQAGSIKAGDYITVSALNGIGMKAGAEEMTVVGKALTSFDGETAVVSRTEVGSGGSAATVSIGRIPVEISISANPLLRNDSNLPEFLRKAAEGVAQKPVNSVRIYLALIILIASVIIAGSMLYSGIGSSIISIGRNPLSRASIIGGLIQVVIAGLMVFIIGIFAVYLLLKL